MAKSIIVPVFALLVATVTSAAAADRYWVIQNSKTGKCTIVTKNPVIDGDIAWGDGPYNSKKGAKIARGGVAECPRK